jgi:hypothetical protein
MDKTTLPSIAQMAPQLQRKPPAIHYTRLKPGLSWQLSAADAFPVEAASLRRTGTTRTFCRVRGGLHLGL